MRRWPGLRGSSSLRRDELRRFCEGIMRNGITATFEYDGLRLTCDEERFARLRDLICKEAAVALAKDGRVSENPGIKFISIRRPSDDSASGGAGWLGLVPAVVAGCLSSAVSVVGVVTIVGWLMRLVA